MRDSGFDYSDRPIELRIILGPELRTTDREFIDQYGFGISTVPPSSSTQVSDPNGPVFEALSQPAQDGWNDAEVRCETESAAAVTSSLDLDRINSLLSELEGFVNADREFLAAEREWKDCTEAAGFHFAGESWGDLVREYTDEWQQGGGAPDPAFTRRELAAATAAADCAGPMWAAQASARRAGLEQLDSSLAAQLYGA